MLWKLYNDQQQAGTLFLYGIYRVKMEDIAVGTGRSKRIIYKYFKDKGALAMLIIAYEMEENPVAGFFAGEWKVQWS